MTKITMPMEGTVAIREETATTMNRMSSRTRQIFKKSKADYETEDTIMQTPTIPTITMVDITRATISITTITRTMEAIMTRITTKLLAMVLKKTLRLSAILQ